MDVDMVYSADYMLAYEEYPVHDMNDFAVDNYVMVNSSYMDYNLSSLFPPDDNLYYHNMNGKKNGDMSKKKIKRQGLTHQLFFLVSSNSLFNT